jgi:hypothetical protein
MRRPGQRDAALVEELAVTQRSIPCWMVDRNAPVVVDEADDVDEEAL